MPIIYIGHASKLSIYQLTVSLVSDATSNNAVADTQVLIAYIGFTHQNLISSYQFKAAFVSGNAGNAAGTDTGNEAVMPVQTRMLSKSDNGY